LIHAENPEWKDLYDTLIQFVMPALVAGIHVFSARKQVVDGRDKPGHDGSLETKKPTELRKLRPRRAKAVRRVAVIAVTDRHGAEQHLFRRHFDERADDAVHAGPGFLRAGIEAVAAGEDRQGVDIAAEIGRASCRERVYACV